MANFYFLALVAACGAASAQTPARNPMPDGSRDLYLGLGAVSAPRYEGAHARRIAALPVLQFEWSNGIFISGMSAGVHLSSAAPVEYGPLLVLQPRRSESGNADAIGAVDNATAPSSVAPQSPLLPTRFTPVRSRLDGMDPVGARLLGRAVFPLLKAAYDENAVLVLNRKPGQYVLRPLDGRNGGLAPALPVNEGTIFAADPDDGFKTVFYRFAGTPARGQVVTEDAPLAIAPVLE